MRILFIGCIFMGLLPAQTITERLDEAKELLRSKTQVSRDQATDVLQGAVAMCESLADPGCPDAYAWYGIVLQSQMGDDQAALRKRVEPMYAKAIEHSASAPKPLFLELHGRLLKVLGEDFRAELLLSRALHLRKNAIAAMNTQPVGGLVLRIGGGVERPELISRVEPEYTAEARILRCDGVSILKIVVDADGNARNIRLERSLGFDLDEEAVKAIGRWQFKPAMKDGVAVAVEANVEVNFRLL